MEKPPQRPYENMAAISSCKTSVFVNGTGINSFYITLKAFPLIFIDAEQLKFDKDSHLVL